LGQTAGVVAGIDIGCPSLALSGHDQSTKTERQGVAIDLIWNIATMPRSHARTRLHRRMRVAVIRMRSV
jgi:hypothetical protein